METPALDEGEPAIAPRPSRYERLRAAAAARGIPLSAILAFCGVVVAVYLTGKIAYRMLDILARPALSIGKGAASLLGTLLTIFEITTLVLLEGPKMRSGVLGSLPPERADFLPMVGGALAGIPTVAFALAHSLTAGLITAAVFVGYQQLENHVLNPLIMSKTVKVSPLLVLMSVLLGTSLGDWAGGVFGGFVAALISIPCAAALQVIVREIWRSTALSPGRALAYRPGQ
jgi:predicted PurR-regulated permease PerM